MPLYVYRCILRSKLLNENQLSICSYCCQYITNHSLADCLLRQANCYRQPVNVSVPNVHFLVLPTRGLLQSVSVCAPNTHFLIPPTCGLLQSVSSTAPNIHLLVLPTHELFLSKVTLCGLRDVKIQLLMNTNSYRFLVLVLQLSIFLYCLHMNCYRLSVLLLQTSIFWYCLHMNCYRLTVLLLQTSILAYCLHMNCYRLSASLLQTSIFWYCLHVNCPFWDGSVQLTGHENPVTNKHELLQVVSACAQISILWLSCLHVNCLRLIASAPIIHLLVLPTHELYHLRWSCATDRTLKSSYWQVWTVTGCWCLCPNIHLVAVRPTCELL